MSNAIKPSEVHKPSASDEQKNLAMLYDEHAAVVLGFLEKMENNKEKAEELLQAVFLALPSRLHEFDAGKGRFVVWLLRLARTISAHDQKITDLKTDDDVPSTNTPIREQASNVGSSGTNQSRSLMPEPESSVVELLYVKGYTFAQAAAELGVDERSLQLMVRTELKKYRR